MEYIYIYILSQNSKKINLESKLNFNWIPIVLRVSYIIFNFCTNSNPIKFQLESNFILFYFLRRSPILIVSLHMHKLHTSIK